MGFFITELSEPSLISSFISKSQHVSHLLFTVLGALMIKNICPDPFLVDPGIQPYANKRNNQWTVSPGIYSNNKSPSEEHLIVPVFYGTPFGKPSSYYKNNYFNSETSWEFLCAISSRRYSKRGLIDYK